MRSVIVSISLAKSVTRHTDANIENHVLGRYFWRPNRKIWWLTLFGKSWSFYFGLSEMG